MKHGKKYINALAQVDREELLTIPEALTKVKALSTAKFDETVELAIRLGIDPAKGVVFPLIVAGFGIIASIGAIFSVRARRRDRTAMSAINRGYRLGGVAVLVAAFLVAQFYVKDLKVFWAVLIGVALGNRIHYRTNVGLFRTIVYSVLIASGLVLGWSTLR